MRTVYPIPIEVYRGCAICETVPLMLKEVKTKCLFAVVEWGEPVVTLPRVQFNVSDEDSRKHALKVVKKRIDLYLKSAYS